MSWLGLRLAFYTTDRRVALESVDEPIAFVSDFIESHGGFVPGFGFQLEGLYEEYGFEDFAFIGAICRASE